MSPLLLCPVFCAGLPDEADIMAGIATDATGISSLQSGLETPDVALNLRKQGDSIVSDMHCLLVWGLFAYGSMHPKLSWVRNCT